MFNIWLDVTVDIFEQDMFAHYKLVSNPIHMILPTYLTAV